MYVFVLKNLPNLLYDESFHQWLCKSIMNNFKLTPASYAYDKSWSLVLHPKSEMENIYNNQ